MSGEGSEWGLYPWFEEHGAEQIHSDDLGRVRALGPNGKVFQLIDAEGGFLRLRYGATEIRVRPALFSRVDARPHAVGDHVVLRDGRSAEVFAVLWHHQRGEPMYQLRVDGKETSRRYWEADFVPQAAAGLDG